MTADKLSTLEKRIRRWPTNAVIDETILGGRRILDPWQETFGDDRIVFNHRLITVDPATESTLRVRGQLAGLFAQPNVPVELIFFVFRKQFECLLVFDTGAVPDWHFDDMFPLLPSGPQLRLPGAPEVVATSFLRSLGVAAGRLVFSSFDYAASAASMPGAEQTPPFPLTGVEPRRVRRGLNITGAMTLSEDFFGPIFALAPGLREGGTDFPVYGYLEPRETDHLIRLWVRRGDGPAASWTMGGLGFALDALEVFGSTQKHGPYGSWGMRVHLAVEFDSGARLPLSLYYLLGSTSFILSLSRLGADRHGLGRKTTHGLGRKTTLADYYSTEAMGDELASLLTAFGTVDLLELSLGVSLPATIDSFQLEVGKSRDEGDDRALPTWTLPGLGLDLVDPRLAVGVTNPFTNRAGFEVQARGMFEVAGGRIAVSGTLPDFEFYGELVPGTYIDAAEAMAGLIGLKDEVIPPLQVSDLGLEAWTLEDSNKRWHLGFRMELEGDWGVELGSTRLAMRGLRVELDKDTGQGGATTGRLVAIAELFDTEFMAIADKLENGWQFTGQIAPGEVLAFRAVADALLPDSFKQDGRVALPDGLQNLAIDGLSFRFMRAEESRDIEFSSSAITAFRLGGQNYRLDAKVHYLKARQGSGTGAETETALEIAGALGLYGADTDEGDQPELEIEVDFSRQASASTAAPGTDQSGWHLGVRAYLPWAEAPLSGSIENQSVGGKSHKIITLRPPGVKFGPLLDFCAGKAGIVVPNWDPLDSLRDIDFNDFEFTIDLTVKRFAVDYTFGEPLRFEVGGLYLGTLQALSIGVHKRKGKRTVVCGLAGSFFGQSYPVGNPLVWDLQEPPPLTRPKPGIVELRYLGLGQHVALPQQRQYRRMKELLLDLREQAKPPESLDDPLGILSFSADSQWFVGVDIELAGTLRVGALFNDPNLYGLTVALTGPRAMGLAGFRFEILYQKLPSGVGKYATEVTLPDQLRTLQMGVVSATLPAIGVEIYTNGDFRVDLGFPRTLHDFSRCGTLQVLIFTGSGGLYLARRGSDTSDQVPRVDRGRFDLVLEFGVGLNFGLGRSIRRGPLAAELSLTITGIVEGVLAWWSLDIDTDAEKFLYYRARGTLAIVGRVAGALDFGIIRISVELVVYAGVTATLEIYSATSVELFARIRARASVKVIFVTISFEFDMSVRHKLELGRAGLAPWGPVTALPAAPAFALAAAPRLARRAAPRARPQPQRIDLELAPCFTVALPADLRPPAQSQQVTVVPLLVIRTEAESAEPAPFSRLAAGLLRHVLEDHAVVIGQRPVISLQALYDLHDRELTLPDLYEILEARFHFTIAAPNEEQPGAGASFPMLPALEIDLAGGQTDGFQRIGSQMKCGGAAFDRLDDYLDQLTASEPSDGSRTEGAKSGRHVPDATLVEHLFREYFSLLLQTAIQQAIDHLEQYEVVAADRSLKDLVGQLESLGASPNDDAVNLLAIANQNRPLLRPGTEWTLSKLEYEVTGGEDPSELAQRLGVDAADIALDGADVGTTIQLPEIRYAPESGETLRSIADRLRVPLENLASAVAAQREIFTSSERLRVPNLPAIEIDTLINELVDKSAFSNAAAVVSRSLLSGMRVPDIGMASIPTFPLVSLAGLQYPIRDEQSQLRVRLGAHAGLSVSFASPDAPSSEGDPPTLTIPFTPGRKERAAMQSGTPSPITARPMRPFEYVADRYPLPRGMRWFTREPATTGEAMVRELWRLPDGFPTDRGDAGGKPVWVELRRNSYTDDSRPSATQTVGAYRWVTCIEVAIARLSASAAAGSEEPSARETAGDASYVVEGSQPSTSEALDAALAAMAQGARARLDIAYPLPADPTGRPAGLRSDPLDPAGTFLVRTSAVEDSQIPAVATLASGSSDSGEAGGFLRLLQYAGDVPQARVYLRLARLSGEVGFPAHVFDAEGRARLRVILDWDGNEEARAFPGPQHNAVIIDEVVDPSKEIIELRPLLHVVAEPSRNLQAVAAELSRRIGARLSVHELAEANRSIAGLLDHAASVDGIVEATDVDSLETLFSRYREAVSPPELSFQGFVEAIASLDILRFGARLQTEPGWLHKQATLSPGQVGVHATRRDANQAEGEGKRIFEERFSLLSVRLGDTETVRASGEGLPMIPTESPEETLGSEDV